MLLTPICLSDHRVWQWKSSAEPLSPRWRGCASAALLTLRVQAAVIYAISSLSKTMDWEWRTGPVMKLLINTSSSAWGVIIVEVAIAVAICAGDRARYLAFALGAALHLGMIVVLRLPTFRCCNDRITSHRVRSDSAESRRQIHAPNPRQRLTRRFDFRHRLYL
jgi:hypothetical protein